MKTLTGLQAIKHILDPIHGPIPLTKVELDIISTPVFQRLRGITQLSMASLVFPSATHNRFQHCIGTVHVIDKFLYTLKLENKLNSDNVVSNRIIQKMRIAALLHDCGHLSFSHTFENLYKESNIHEKFGKHIIERSVISDMLKNNKIEPKTIGGLITGDVFVEDDDAVICRNLLPLLDSDADADRMDYLLRDGYFTGVPYGKVDIDRICNFVNLHDNLICFNEKAQNALEDFLFSRYQMHKIVYIHKTVICYELLLQKLYNDFIKKYRDSDNLPFFLPKRGDLENSNNDWFNNVFNNITEASFFNSIRTLLKSNNLNDNEKKDLNNLYMRFLRRKPIKNCFRIDDLPETAKTEYCDTEKKLFGELQKYPLIVNHWSFLRHDPSKPIRIVSEIKGEVDDLQDPEQVRICSKTGSGIEVELLQKKTNSYIKSLTKHHSVLICYYHIDKVSQKNIKDLASKHFPQI